jgi:Sulfotransferase family
LTLLQRSLLPVSVFGPLVKAFNFAVDRELGLGALEGLADCFADTGRKDDAVFVCRRMIDFAPNHASGYGNLVNCEEGAGIPDQAIAAMLDMLATGSPCDCQRMGLHYSLGKVYDRRGLYGEAFAHFAIANAVRARLAGRFDVESLRKDVDARIKVLGPERIAEMSRHGCQDDFLICIVGMPRSGTTLIEQILSSHPEVVGLGERMDFYRVAEGLRAKLKSRHAYPKCCAELPPERVSGIARSLRDELRKTAGPCARVVTKLPGDCFELGLIKILFPRARFIHCQRHPIDTCLSCYMQNFRHILYSTDLATLAAVYRLYQRTMFHWQRALPSGSLFECSYEQTVTDPEPVIRGLYEHCGICFNDDWSRFPERARRVVTASRWQVRRPLYQSSVQRWKNYARFLGPLLEFAER